MTKAEAQQIIDLKRHIIPILSGNIEAVSRLNTMCDTVIAEWVKPDAYVKDYPQVTEWLFDGAPSFYRIVVPQPDITVDVQGRKYKISFEKAKEAGLVREVTE
jgi:hypothetical protein